MCGLFGMLLARSLTDEDVVRAEKACQALAHRGPDGQGTYVDRARGLFLGHRRLAIIDPTARSDQPMKRGNDVMVYNGEIYNYRELRDELMVLGEQFETTGDTEVLMAVYQRWKIQGLTKLDGMFAMALWDGDTLTLAVDPFGEKPLYWLRRPEGHYFASEAQILVDFFGLPVRPKEADARTFLVLGYLPSPNTGIENLDLFPPATLVELSNKHPSRAQNYWKKPPVQIRTGKVAALGEASLDQVAEVLTTSLQRRLRSDVPLGLFLSGGVDSALIAALCAKELKTQLQTLTVAFPDGVDEAPTAAQIAKYFGHDHRVVNSQADETWRQADAECWSLYGSLNDNMTAWSIRLMSRLAKPHMTVALSGLGGDELFFGYNKYGFLWRRRLAYRVPKILAGVIGKIPHAKLSMVQQYLAGDDFWRYISLKNNGLGPLLGELLEGLPVRSAFPNDRQEPVLAARQFELENALAGSYIASVDRGSMRASLEVRTPFLSRPLLETLAQFDPRSLIAFGQKDLLKRLLVRYLPKAIWDQPKRGFVFPLRRYLETLPDQIPDIPQLPSGLVRDIHQNRLNPAYAGLAFRLQLLAHANQRGSN